MSDLSTDSALLATFERLHRGDPAPDWVGDALIDAWCLPAHASVHLIVVSENVTFRVDVDDVPTLVVRLARPGYAAGLAHLRSELEWIEALRRDLGLSTPGPVRGADGAAVQELRDGSGRTWRAVAFRFVPGTVLEERDDLDAWYRMIGSTTAEQHRHARSWRPPAGFERFAWGVEDLVGDTARWGDWRAAELTGPERTLLATAEERACIDLASAESAEARLGLIHADLRPSNVLTDGDAITVIDFDDCGFGYYLYDFAAALTFYEHRAEAPGMAASWLDGYREVAPLSKADLQTAGALSMLRRLAMLGWATTHRRDALPSDLWDENLPGTIDVAARYLAEPQWLVRG